MNDIVERAAKAHYERLHYTSWESLTPSTKAGFIAAMRAAIEALREPTEEMKEAAFEAHDKAPTSLHVSPAAAVPILNAMIDAILKEDPDHG